MLSTFAHPAIEDVLGPSAGPLPKNHWNIQLKNNPRPADVSAALERVAKMFADAMEILAKQTGR